jgi:drug/metabolite transporter (DMT)-like permease
LDQDISITYQWESGLHQLQARKGIMLMFLAMQVVPIMDGIAKFLSMRYPVLEVVWARFFFHFLFMIPVVLWVHGPRGLVVNRPWLLLARGGLLLIATLCFFTAITEISIPSALSLLFVSPIIVTIASALLLGEQVGIRRWIAVLIGFVAVIIIFRPTIGSFHWASLLALGAGIAYAFYFLSTRWLTGRAPPRVMLIYQSMLGAVVMSITMFWVWVSPTPTDWILMAALGGIAAGGHYLIIKSFEFAEASLLAPYGFSEIIMATVVAYIGFGNFPDPWTWLGICLIIGVGIFLSLPPSDRVQ